MKLKQRQNEGSQRLVACAVAILLVLIIGISGTLVFLYVWHQGNEKAEAFSGLLAFLAAIASSIVTVIFIYLTYASLQKAQASIDLQREELEQMKSSVDLQRREWEQKVRVFPQFWITTLDDGRWFKPDPGFPAGPQILPLSFNKRFALKVWNHSEQSFLVESIRMQRSDLVMVANFQFRDTQLIVKPHSVAEEDISYLVMPLITQTQIPNQTANLVIKDPDNCSKIFIRLIYSDWSQKHAKTEVHEFELKYRPGDASISINEIREPSGTIPGI